MKHSVNEIELTNGARGLLIHVPNATVMSYEINFRAGDYLVERDKSEVPHLMEHVLLGANKQFPRARDFHAELEKNGADSNAHTSTYDITYEAECADFEWDRVLNLMLVAISEPLFLREEFKAEYGNVKDERAARSNNHFLHLNAVTREAYGLVALSDREALKLMRNVKLKDLIEHYKKTHTTSNMRFIFAGDLHGKREAIKRMVEKINLPKGRGRLQLPIEQPKKLDAPIFVLRPSVKTLYFSLDIFALKRFEDPEWDALQLVNSTLTATLHSRILGEAREKGLVYGMSSSLDVTRDCSLWWFGSQVIPKNALPLFGIITKEITEVRSGKITDIELNSTKQYMLGRHQRRGQTVGGIAAGYAGRYYFEDRIEDYHGIPARIKAITTKRVINSVDQMFEDNIGGLGLLGNSKSKELTDQLNAAISPLWK